MRVTNRKGSVPTLDVAAMRAQFPILEREVYGRPLVYLDNAASAQKPRTVIDRMTEVMESEYANVHRGLHFLSNTATEAFEAARESARAFMNAAHTEEIVFTSGATDAINLVAASWGAENIEEGDEILLTDMEHHSNIVPWHFHRERKGAVLTYAKVGEDGALSAEAVIERMTPRTKLVAITHMSNVLGTVTPAKTIIEAAHARGIPVLLDGCQAAVHVPIDVRELDADFYVFSGHKVYGPTGIGVLYAKRALLEAMPPYRGGGEMIAEVSLENVTYNDPPHRFEAGTPAIVEAIGLGAALEFLMGLDRDAVHAHEAGLLARATAALEEMNSVRILGNAPGKGGILAFVLEGAHAHDVATILDRQGIAVRAGHHCAQPLMQRFGVTSTARASFALYNTESEVDRFVEGLQTAREMLG